MDLKRDVYAKKTKKERGEREREERERERCINNFISFYALHLVPKHSNSKHSNFHKNRQALKFKSSTKNHLVVRIPSNMQGGLRGA